MRLYNPFYHWRRAAVDFRAMRQSFQTLGKPQRFSCEEALSHVLHGRLLLASSVAIPATIIGITVGWFVQILTGSIPAGLLINLVVANILGAIGLEIIWAWLCRDLYTALGLHGWARFRTIVHDLLPIHGKALIGVLVINALSMGLTTYVLENIHHWQPRWNLNRFVPASLISPIIGWLLLDAPFIRYMNDYYDTRAKYLAKYHRAALESSSSAECDLPRTDVEAAASGEVSSSGSEPPTATTKFSAAAPSGNGHASEPCDDNTVKRSLLAEGHPLFLRRDGKGAPPGPMD